MIIVILILVLTVVVCEGNVSPSAHNAMSYKEIFIKNTGRGLKFGENITSGGGGFQVVPFLATFLKLIGNNKLTISVKQGNFTTTNIGQKDKQTQFHTTLPLIKLGNAGNYYYFETSLTLNYFEAFEYCRRNHMDLLSIESKEEDDLIKHYLFKEHPTVNSIWTSGTDIGREGHYIWLSTGEEFTFTNWHAFYVVEPNNFGNSEHCIHMYQYFNTPNFFYWNDLSCNVTYNFVCETRPFVY